MKNSFAFAYKKLTARSRMHRVVREIFFYLVRFSGLTTGLTIYRIFLCGNRRTHWSKMRKFTEYTVYFRADLLILHFRMSSGARCHRFKSSHSDQKTTENKPFLTYFRLFFIYFAQKQRFFLDHIKPAFLRFEEKKVSIFRISFSLTTAMQLLRFDRESGEHFCPPL